MLVNRSQNSKKFGESEEVSDCLMSEEFNTVVKLRYRLITNDVSDYINVLVRIVHIICNHSLFGYLKYICPMMRTYSV
jgi:hypothetical protein